MYVFGAFTVSFLLEFTKCYFSQILLQCVKNVSQHVKPAELQLMAIEKLHEISLRESYPATQIVLYTLMLSLNGCMNANHYKKGNIFPSFKCILTYFF